MKRRFFLLGFTSALAAPAVVRAESLMKLWVPSREMLTAESLERVLVSLPPSSLMTMQNRVFFVMNQSLQPLLISQTGNALSWSLGAGESMEIGA